MASELALLASLGVTAMYLRLKLNSNKDLQIIESNYEQNLLMLQSLYGYNAHSLVSISASAEMWFDPETQCGLTYFERGKMRLVSGEMIGREALIPIAVKRFIEQSAHQNKLVCFLPTTEKFAKAIAPIGFEAVKIAAAPYFNLQNWNPRGNKAKKMRVGCNQARNAGLKVTEIRGIDPTFKKEVGELSQHWLKSRRAEIKFGWLFDLNPFQFSDCKRFFAARDCDNKLVGILAASPIPARDGWYLEDVLRYPDSPKGTTDLLIFETLKLLAADGAKIATLGTVPLAMDGEDTFSCRKYKISKMLFKLSRENGEFFYNFKGLRHFKGKFVPCWWESEYILLPKGVLNPLRIANTFFYAILPGGFSSLVKRRAN